MSVEESVRSGQLIDQIGADAGKIRAAVAQAERGREVRRPRCR